MAKSLKSKTIHALFWSAAQQFAIRALQFGVGVLLARLLSPKEFGLLGMLAVFLALAQVLLDGGFAAALIQRQDLTEAHRSSIFFLNIAAGLFLAVLLWFGSPAIAGFYHQPLLRPVLRVLLLVPVINGFAVVQSTLLVKRLDFKTQTIILSIATFVSGAVAVFLASRGYGVWSLVAQQVLQSALNSSLLWCFSDWRPSLIFSFDALREMFGFGSGMLGAAVLNMANENLFPILIGKLFSAADLGFFNRAQNLQLTASQSLGVIANRVTTTVFSTLQEDVNRFRSGLKKALTSIVALQFPMMIGLAVIAKPLVLIVFTSKWAPCIGYLQLLCFVGLLYPVHVLNLNVLFALGRSDLFLKLDVYKVSISVVTAAITVHWGIMALIWGQLACSLIAFILNTYYTKILINYSFIDQLRDLCPYLAVAVFMGIITAGLGSLLHFGNVGQILFRVAFGVVVYFVACWRLRLHAALELLRLTVRVRNGTLEQPQPQLVSKGNVDACIH